MTKLEELKALNIKIDDAKALYLAAPDNYSNFLAYTHAANKLLAAMNNLFQDLVAVAEAAEKMLLDADAKLYVGEGCSIAREKINAYKTLMALRELTKDADK